MMKIVKFKGCITVEAYSVRVMSQTGFKFIDLQDPGITYDIGDPRIITYARGSLEYCRRVVKHIKSCREEGEVCEDH